MGMIIVTWDLDMPFGKTKQNKQGYMMNLSSHLRSSSLQCHAILLSQDLASWILISWDECDVLNALWPSDASGRSRGWGVAPPPGPRFLHFHAVFGKNWPNNKLPLPSGVGAPSSGKSWIRHWDRRADKFSM